MTPREREILAELDSIEKASPPAAAASAATELMDEFASSTERLKYLIDRYGSSHSSHVKSRLAGTLHRKVVGPHLEEPLPLVVALAVNLRRPDDHPETLITLLSALGSALSTQDFIRIDMAPLGEFLWACLNDCSRLSDQVHEGAVEVLRELLEKGAYNKIFDPHEDGFVIEKLERIAQEFGSIERRSKSHYLAPLVEAMRQGLAQRRGAEVRVPERSEEAREVIEKIRAGRQSL